MDHASFMTFHRPSSITCTTASILFVFDNLMHRFLFLLTLLPLSLSARDDAAIREVAEGKRTEARADWWGFDEKDSSEFLQAAIKSKARKVVIPNMGRPWITRPLKLRSDLELVFEKGVELQALRGDFLDTNASLFSGSNVRNVSISGQGGVVLRMWKEDYQKPPYKPAEWRHTFNFHGAENITLSNLELRESGGDGIYLGTTAGKACKHITIRKMRCIGHHRQGISVINAEDLLVEDCEFNLTKGTAPQAGIDFEPNDPTERLKNCVLRRCVFDQNAASGILFALGRMDASSEPLSITIEDCESRGNHTALVFAMRNPAGVSGRVDFRRCVFADSTHDPVRLRSKTLPGPLLNFEKCVFRHLTVTEKEGAPISIFSHEGQGDPLGGIHFDDCIVEDNAARHPLAYDDLDGTRLEKVTGRITVRHAGKEQVFDIDDKLIATWFPWSVQLKAFTRVPIEPRQLVRASNVERSDYPALGAAFRGDAHFVFTAQKGEKTAFTLTAKVVGRKNEPYPIRVRVIAPSGKETPLAQCMPGAPQSYDVIATEEGVHHLVAAAGQQTVTLHAPARAVSAIAPSGVFHLLGTSQRLYFQVPAGTNEFAVRVAGGGGSEMARAIVRDAAGTVVADEDCIARSRQIPFTRADAAQAAVWSVELVKPSKGVIEDIRLGFDGIAPIIAPAPEALLVPMAKAP